MSANGRPQHGFTLLEVMVVVVILGILAALVVPKIIGRPDEARVTAARQDIASLAQTLKLYRLDNQRYPTTEQGLQALVAKPTSAPVPPNWKAGGYVERLAKDPWGNPYQYLYPRGPARRSTCTASAPTARRAAKATTPTSARGALLGRRASMRRAHARDASKGFTLVEMLVVLAMMGIFLGLVSTAVRPGAQDQPAPRGGTPRATPRPRCGRVPHHREIPRMDLGRPRVSVLAPRYGRRVVTASATATSCARASCRRACWSAHCAPKRPAPRRSDASSFPRAASSLAYSIALSYAAGNYTISSSPVGELRVASGLGGSREANAAK